MCSWQLRIGSPATGPAPNAVQFGRDSPSFTLDTGEIWLFWIVATGSNAASSRCTVSRFRCKRKWQRANPSKFPGGYCDRTSIGQKYRQEASSWLVHKLLFSRGLWPCCIPLLVMLKGLLRAKPVLVGVSYGHPTTGDGMLVLERSHTFAPKNRCTGRIGLPPKHGGGVQVALAPQYGAAKEG